MSNPVVERFVRDDGQHTIVVRQNYKKQEEHVVSAAAAQRRFKKEDERIREQNGGLGGWVFWFDETGKHVDTAWRITQFDLEEHQRALAARQKLKKNSDG